MGEEADFPSIFHVLLVFTSAFFAISQYYENRQARLFQEGQKNLVVDFALADSNDGMREVKKKWDDIQVVKPINNHSIIVGLFILFLLYILFFSIGMFGKWFPVVLQYLSIVLVGLGIFLFINWFRMKNQLTKLNGNIETFNILYQTVRKAIP